MGAGARAPQLAAQTCMRTSAEDAIGSQASSAGVPHTDRTGGISAAHDAQKTPAHRARTSCRYTRVAPKEKRGCWAVARATRSGSDVPLYEGEKHSTINKQSRTITNISKQPFSPASNQTSAQFSAAGSRVGALHHAIKISATGEFSLLSAVEPSCLELNEVYPVSMAGLIKLTKCTSGSRICVKR